MTCTACLGSTRLCDSCQGPMPIGHEDHEGALDVCEYCRAHLRDERICEFGEIFAAKEFAKRRGTP